jgi:hypothetical protein
LHPAKITNWPELLFELEFGVPCHIFAE